MTALDPLDPKGRGRKWVTTGERKDLSDCTGDSGSWILLYGEIMDETEVIKSFAQTSASHGPPSVQL